MSDTREKASDGKAKQMTGEAKIKKEAGNIKFAQGCFAEAEKLYSQAIDSDPIAAALWSNRALARLKLGRASDAFSDAQRCIQIDPAFTKGYHRKALALRAMSASDCETAAYETYADAFKVCPKDQWLLREMHKAKKDMQKAHLEKAVASTDQMIKIFKFQEDVWDRLSMLAYFWNASSRTERFEIFSRFLTIGNNPDKIKEFGHEEMNSMAITNYLAMGKRENVLWITFYKALPSAEKVTVLEGMWNLASPSEKDAVIKDLQHFCAKRAPHQEQDIADSSSSL